MLSCVCTCGYVGDEGERKERNFMNTFANNAHHPTPKSIVNCIYCTLHHLHNSMSLIEQTVLKAVKWFPDPFVVRRQCSWTECDATPT